MNLLGYVAVGLLYLPFVATPLLIIYWYAFATTQTNEQEQDGIGPRDKHNEP